MRSDDLVKFSYFTLLAILCFAGLAILGLYFWDISQLPIRTILGSEPLTVPLDTFLTGTDSLALNTQNFLLIERYASDAPLSFPEWSQMMGMLIWLLFLVLVWLLTMLRRNAFLLGAGTLIFLLTISGLNSLNIAGIGSNFGLIIALFCLLLPAAAIHLFFDNLSLGWRAMFVFGLGIACPVLLIYFANAPYPTLLFSENTSLMALTIAAGFVLYIGNAILAGVFLFLGKLNEGVGIKMGWHFGGVGLLYLLLLGLMLLDITGSLAGWPLPPFQVLLMVAGIVGYPVVVHKMEHTSQPFAAPWVGKLFYLTAFSICLLVLFKGMGTVNSPMVDFLNHVFVYSQLGFGLLFFLYVWVNFSGIINSGKAIGTILYKPPFFPFFHYRLGGVLSLLIFLVYADGIVAVQFSTASTQLSADYYYASERPVEATVLYENAFERYRENDKALLAAAHLYLSQNQPTLALKTLERSFEENPQVPDILLLSQLLEKRQRINEAIFYLKEGLEYYPTSTYLSNNLALIYHGMNRPEDALAIFDTMAVKGQAENLNELAVKIAHGKVVEPSDESETSLKLKINRLAHANATGGTTPQVIAMDSLKEAGNLINRALLRNQLSTRFDTDLEEEFRETVQRLSERLQLDLSVEESIRESRLLLEFRVGEVNELLKQLNGMAFRFTGNAGYYHSFAGWVLSREGDFEKAAIEWKQAMLKGFSRFTPAHLPYLYFGGMQEEAAFIAGTQNVNYPSWMRFDEAGSLESNDTVQFYQTLARLPKMLGKELLPALDSLQGQHFKQYLAKEMLLKKGHWLETDRLDNLYTLAMKAETSEAEKVFVQKYVEMIQGKQPVEPNQADLSTGGNAYRTPMVLAAIERVSEAEERYRLLQEASQFNKDPLLWIELVKYCRIIGLDQYASSNLATMSEWIGQEDLTQLQLEHLKFH
ncbi:tetratricopeptide repeat protein [Cyclobacterium salsum]|uniref:tetratricopeptide repeat protein n=1 Tax=Cyclobacterium salsum TaxID=2666329 RepID=UPI0013906EE9|nr:tetratricopeptide repeat protein [Cyclobacterium salsum]